MKIGKKLRVGMIGTGGFGARRRALMRATGLFEIVAAYDLNPEALANCAREDGAALFRNYEELLAAPDLEAMVVSSGAQFHAEQVLAALDRGLHVFVEKPLCSTMEEVKALVDKQKKTGLVVGVGHVDHASNGASRQIRDMIRNGFFGVVATFEMVAAHSGGLEIKPGDWRGVPEKNPGGMLFQCGCHNLHELLFLFGPIREVTAMMRYDVHTTRTADVAHCILRFDSGLIGTLGAYHVTPYRHTFSIYGTARSLYIDTRAPAYGDPSCIAVQSRRKCEAEPHEPFQLAEGDDAAGNLKSFYKAVREGGAPYPSLMDGARVMRVIFAADESARSGRVARCTGT